MTPIFSCATQIDMDEAVLIGACCAHLRMHWVECDPRALGGEARAAYLQDPRDTEGILCAMVTASCSADTPVCLVSTCEDDFNANGLL